MDVRENDKQMVVDENIKKGSEFREGRREWYYSGRLPSVKTGSGVVWINHICTKTCAKA